MEKMKRTIVFLLFFLFTCLSLHSRGISFITAVPQRGDGVLSLFRRYEIPLDSTYLDLFYELNSEILGEKRHLHLNRNYLLPIVSIPYNKISIRSTLDIGYDTAKLIQDFNETLQEKGVRKTDYRKNLDLWALYFSLPEKLRYKAGEDTSASKGVESNEFDIFGAKFKNIKQIDNALEGRVYYLKSGHGGPDPGAVAERDGYLLCEDEYAYDITLRLGRKLIEHGAKVYIIVRDKNDGIRDDAYLKNSNDKYLYGGDTISKFQLERLRKRAEIINDLYAKNKNTAKKQELIVIHVDSRSYGKRIDVFFYHHPNSEEGKKLAETLQQTIKAKYNAAQPDRGYQGTVSPRNLYILNHALPTSVFIELGNIRNPQDQIRLIKSDNRQALANWLCDGLIKAASENE